MKKFIVTLENFEWQKSVKSRLSTPPLTIIKGDRYLVIPPGVGEWSGQEDKIAWFDGESWLFITPQEGMSIWVKDEDEFYVWNGSNWIKVLSLENLSDVYIQSPQLGQFLRFNGKWVNDIISTNDIPTKIPESITLALDVNYQVWTHMPNALTEFRGTTLNRTKVDLTNATQARLVVKITAVPVAIPDPPPELRIQYSLGEVGWFYLDGVSGPGVVIDQVKTKASPWVNIENNAKRDVFVRIVGVQGDGVMNPSFGLICLQVK